MHPHTNTCTFSLFRTNTHSFMLLFFLPQPSEFSFYPFFLFCCVQLIHVVLNAFLLLLLLSLHLHLLFSFPILLLLLCLPFHLLVLFHARVLSPTTLPNHPRDRACLLCLFHISAHCSCDGNLSFKYLFLPSPGFFPCRPPLLPPPAYTSFHPRKLKCASSNLAPGHFKTCHIQFRSTHLERVRKSATLTEQAVILLLRNSIKLHAVRLCFGSLSAANQLAVPVTITGLCAAKELQMMIDCSKMMAAAESHYQLLPVVEIQQISPIPEPSRWCQGELGKHTQGQNEWTLAEAL